MRRADCGLLTGQCQSKRIGIKGQGRRKLRLFSAFCVFCGRSLSLCHRKFPVFLVVDGRVMDDSVHSPGPASSIKAIDRTSVHRICSGQVVLTLATAVKELVENSIDAGATSIEVRLKEYGAELIEVIDNGQGVEEENFQGLTLKHHTSKLRDFNDLVGVETFGFRGEALSSLCALSNLTIVTRHKDAAVATKLEFDNNGKIKSQTPSARQVGTTLSLGQLFHTLPVRHKEFQRNVKKEFNKMVHVLNGYCVISTGVRITCTNQTNKGKKSVIVSTNGNESIRENITNIFGPKQFQSLIPFSQVLPSDTVCGDFNIKMPEAKVFSIEGYVSSSEHGQGRGSSDRQFVFVNRRPCDLAKVTRIVNEVYHSYNKHQFPFVVLDVSLAKECVDVNVTPDKRQIFISEEKLLLATIKTSLIQMFEPISSMYQVNNGQPKGNSLGGSPFCQIQKNQTNGNCPVGVLKKSASCPYTSPKVSLTSSLASLKRSFSSAFVKTTGDVDISEASPSHRKPDKQRRLDTFVRVESASPAMRSPVRSVSAESSSTIDDIKLESPTRNERVTLPETDPDSTLHSEQTDSPPTESKELTKWGNIEILTNPELPPKEEKRQFKEKYREESRLLPEDFEQELREELPSETTSTVQGSVPEYTDQAESVVRSSRTVPFSISQLRARLKRRTGVAEADRDKFRSFRARISPTDNQAAEDELKKEIKKDMFAKMEILGQFNLGFIIARSGSDLFIIDQHATDEKYNFETLQKECVIRSQKLIQPQRLELTAANSSILIDNIDIFRTNGFEFEIDEEAPIATRVKLSSMPVSKNWTFGKDDIEELIFMLSDSPGVLCRPSRVRMMFASRACRKSIMVGTALSRAEMRKVVNHMGEIEQPWNCPHGRPTMRHLINLDCLEDLEK